MVISGWLRVYKNQNDGVYVGNNVYDTMSEALTPSVNPNFLGAIPINGATLYTPAVTGPQQPPQHTDGLDNWDDPPLGDNYNDLGPGQVIQESGGT